MCRRDRMQKGRTFPTSHGVTAALTQFDVCSLTLAVEVHAVAQLFERNATSRKVVGSIPDEV
jgi:hypothetical protein